MGSVVIIPKIQEQTVSFISNFPQYVDTIDNKLTEILRDPLFNQFREQLETAGDKFMNSAGDMIQDISKSTVQSLGSFVGAVATILVALLTMPFILFYLLKDGKQLAPYFVKFLPTRMQKPTLNVLSEMNSQVSSYIRGQLTVAFAVAIMFMIGFAVIGLEYAVTLGIIAGFLNLIPYLGSFLAMIPAIFFSHCSRSIHDHQSTDRFCSRADNRRTLDLSISTRESVSNPSSNDFISSADFWEIVRNHRCDLGDSCLCSS